MRLVIDSLIAVMLAAILVGVLQFHRSQQRELRQQQSVHRALANLHEAAMFHGAMGEGPSSAIGLPTRISPLWFNDRIPVNTMVPGRYPWLDVAPDDDMSDHPPDPVITGSDQAQFWYNPTRGVIRARVTPQFTDQETLQLYNQLNGSALKALPTQVDPQRQPQPHGFAMASGGDPSAANADKATDPVVSDAEIPGAPTAPAPRSLQDLSHQRQD